MSVILNNIFISSLAFWRTSITSFRFCLFTLVVYHVTFKMEMTCTMVFCCCVHSCISKLTYHLISIVSFVVAIPISQCGVSPKKDSRLLLGHGLSAVVNLSRTGSVLSSFVAIRRALSTMLDVYGWHCSFISSSCVSAF